MMATVVDMEVDRFGRDKRMTQVQLLHDGLRARLQQHDRLIFTHIADAAHSS